MRISEAIENALAATPVYRNRISTDKLFTLPDGSVRLKGNIDDAIRFIEEYQLLDGELWSRFVQQFRDTEPKADDADNGWRGEYWGKMMRGACFTYAYTGNNALYDLLVETVRDMMSVQEESGRISSYSVEKQYNGWDIWARKYVLLGMQYFLEICKDERLASDIVECMCRQADYMIDTLGPKEEGKIMITDASSHWKGLNSSSLLEPVIRLYNITGTQKYLNFATYIVSCGGTKGENIYELAAEGKLYPYQYKVTKAYEMMSCFEGLLEYYRVTGIEKWKRAAVNLADLIAASDITVIGSAGCTHELFDHSRIRQLTTEYFGVMQETCVTVTWMKFCYQVLCLTGNSKYADEIERSVYNGMLGAINYDRHSGNGGFPFDSYSPLLFNTRLTGVGGRKTMADGSEYGCCACIGSAGTGIIPKYAAMLRRDGIAVNLFSQGSFIARTPKGATVKFNIKTKYPLEGNIAIRVASRVKESFVIAVRIPYWSKKTFAAVNGEMVKVKPGEYAEFERVWVKGDEITLRFDMRCAVITPDKSEYADANSEYHVALRRGPLMLARDARLAGDIESVVKFAPDKDGYVPCERIKTVKFPHFYAFAVTQADGTKIEMLDYPSAGRTWDKESMTTVWMPTKNYWNVDLSKPVTLICPSFGNNLGDFYPTLDSSNNVVISKEKPACVTLEADGKGKYRIRFENGRCLDHEAGTQKVYATEKGALWSIVRFAQNRYKIYTESGLVLSGSNSVGAGLRVNADSFSPANVLKLTN